MEYMDISFVLFLKSVPFLKRVYIYKYIYIYECVCVCERIKEDASILCYPEFRA